MVGTVWILWTLIVFVQDFHVVQSLECWKCIQHDCHLDPRTNQKAEKVTCAVGEHCLKVRFQMFHNETNTYFDSVVRSCSPYTCPSAGEEEHMACMNHNRDYMFKGCSLRSCCNDRDLCNSGSAPAYVLLLTVVLQILLLIT